MDLNLISQIVGIVAGILAIITALFAGIRYFFKKNAELTSNVEQIDIRLDANDSLYTQKSEGDKKIITPEKNITVEKISSSKYKFPSIDFKFRNTGNAVAFLWEFSLDIIDIKVNIEPVLSFDSYIDNSGNLVIEVKNTGWGDAKNVHVKIKNEILNSCFSENECEFSGEIKSNERKEIFLFNGNRVANKLNQKIDQISVVCSYSDEDNNEYTDEYYVRGKKMEIGENGFQEIHHPPIRHQMAPSDEIYITYVDPDKLEKEIPYPISRKILSGDVERFHIMVGSNKSCKVSLRFVFKVDKSEIITSEVFEISIYNPIGSELNSEFKDGNMLKRDIQKMDKENKELEKIQIKKMKRQLEHFPFLEEKQ